MRNAVIGFAAVIAASVPAVSAGAHAFLSQAVPPVGGMVSAPPQQIRLRFSEGIEPVFSNIELATAQGQPIQIGPAAVNPGDNTELILSVPHLGPGRYKVTWQVVSVDTHRTEGAFNFEVKP